MATTAAIEAAAHATTKENGVCLNFSVLSSRQQSKNRNMSRELSEGGNSSSSTCTNSINNSSSSKNQLYISSSSGLLNTSSNESRGQNQSSKETSNSSRRRRRRGEEAGKSRRGLSSCTFETAAVEVVVPPLCRQNGSVFHSEKTTEQRTGGGICRGRRHSSSYVCSENVVVVEEGNKTDTLCPSFFSQESAFSTGGRRTTGSRDCSEKEEKLAFAAEADANERSFSCGAEVLEKKSRERRVSLSSSRGEKVSAAAETDVEEKLQQKKREKRIQYRLVRDVIKPKVVPLRQGGTGSARGGHDDASSSGGCALNRNSGGSCGNWVVALNTPAAPHVNTVAGVEPTTAEIVAGLGGFGEREEETWRTSNRRWQTEAAAGKSRKGRFTEAEKEAVIAALLQYAAEHGLEGGVSEAVQHILQNNTQQLPSNSNSSSSNNLSLLHQSDSSCSTKSSPGQKRAARGASRFAAIARWLPQRSCASVYFFIRRNLLSQVGPLKRGPWTAAEAQQLLQMEATLRTTHARTRFARIGAVLNRTASSVYDKWKEIKPRLFLSAPPVCLEEKSQDLHESAAPSAAAEAGSRQEEALLCGAAVVIKEAPQKRKEHCLQHHLSEQQRQQPCQQQSPQSSSSCIGQTRTKNNCSNSGSSTEQVEQHSAVEEDERICMGMSGAAVGELSKGLEGSSGLPGIEKEKLLLSRRRQVDDFEKGEFSVVVGADVVGAGFACGWSGKAGLQAQRLKTGEEERRSEGVGEKKESGVVSKDKAGEVGTGEEHHKSNAVVAVQVVAAQRQEALAEGGVVEGEVVFLEGQEKKQKKKLQSQQQLSFFGLAGSESQPGEKKARKTENEETREEAVVPFPSRRREGGRRGSVMRRAAFEEADALLHAIQQQTGEQLPAVGIRWVFLQRTHFPHVPVSQLRLFYTMKIVPRVLAKRMGVDSALPVLLRFIIRCLYTAIKHRKERTQTEEEAEREEEGLQESFSVEQKQKGGIDQVYTGGQQQLGVVLPYSQHRRPQNEKEEKSKSGVVLDDLNDVDWLELLPFCPTALPPFVFRRAVTSLLSGSSSSKKKHSNSRDSQQKNSGCSAASGAVVAAAGQKSLQLHQQVKLLKKQLDSVKTQVSIFRDAELLLRAAVPQHQLAAAVRRELRKRCSLYFNCMQQQQTELEEQQRIDGALSAKAERRRRRVVGVVDVHASRKVEVGAGVDEGEDLGGEEDSEAERKEQEMERHLSAAEREEKWEHEEKLLGKAGVLTVLRKVGERELQRLRERNRAFISLNFRPEHVSADATPPGSLLVVCDKNATSSTSGVHLSNLIEKGSHHFFGRRGQSTDKAEKKDQKILSPRNGSRLNTDSGESGDRVESAEQILSSSSSPRELSFSSGGGLLQSLYQKSPHDDQQQGSTHQPRRQQQKLVFGDQEIAKLVEPSESTRGDKEEEKNQEQFLRQPTFAKDSADGRNMQREASQLQQRQMNSKANSFSPAEDTEEKLRKQQQCFQPAENATKLHRRRRRTLAAALAEDTSQEAGDPLGETAANESGAEEPRSAATEMTVETAVDTTSQTAVDTTSQTAADTTSQTAVDTTSQTAVDTTSQTAVDTTSETAVDTTSQTAVDTTSETAVDTTSETAAVKTEEACTEKLKGLEEDAEASGGVALDEARAYKKRKRKRFTEKTGLSGDLRMHQHTAADAAAKPAGGFWMQRELVGGGAAITESDKRAAEAETSAAEALETAEQEQRRRRKELKRKRRAEREQKLKQFGVIESQKTETPLLERRTAGIGAAAEDVRGTSAVKKTGTNADSTVSAAALSRASAVAALNRADVGTAGTAVASGNAAVAVWPAGDEKSSRKKKKGDHKRAAASAAEGALAAAAVALEKAAVFEREKDVFHEVQSVGNHVQRLEEEEQERIILKQKKHKQKRVTFLHAEEPHSREHTEAYFESFQRPSFGDLEQYSTTSATRALPAAAGVKNHQQLLQPHQHKSLQKLQRKRHKEQLQQELHLLHTTKQQHPSFSLQPFQQNCDRRANSQHAAEGDSETVVEVDTVKKKKKKRKREKRNLEFEEAEKTMGPPTPVTQKHTAWPTISDQAGVDKVGMLARVDGETTNFETIPRKKKKKKKKNADFREAAFFDTTFV